jgi:hypothetical protein
MKRQAGVEPEGEAKWQAVLEPIEGADTQKPIKDMLPREGSIFVGYDRSVKQTKRFQLWAVNTFLDYYLDSLLPHNRFYHEYVDPIAPCRVYFDLEYEQAKHPERAMDDELWEAILEEIDFQVMSIFLGQFGVSSCDRTLWYAHRPGKFSTHVVYDLWVGSVATLLNVVVNPVVERVSLLAKHCIDLQLYSTNAFKCLRMPYSNKYERPKQETLVHCLLPRNGNTTPDREALCKSLLTVCRRPEQPVYYGDGDDDHRRRPEASVETVDAATKKAIAAVEKWLVEVECARQGSVNMVQQTATKARWEFRGVYCPCLGEAHDTQQQSLTLYLQPPSLLYSCIPCRYTWVPNVSARMLCQPALYGPRTDEVMEAFQK